MLGLALGSFLLEFNNMVKTLIFPKNAGVRDCHIKSHRLFQFTVKEYFRGSSQRAKYQSFNIEVYFLYPPPLDFRLLLYGGGALENLEMKQHTF